MIGISLPLTTPRSVTLRTQGGFKSTEKSTIMIPEQPKEDEIFHQAMDYIDPFHTLMLGTESYDSVRDMILGWIDQFGPNDTLHMAKKGAMHLDMWLKCS